jgi:hypothetical protein
VEEAPWPNLGCGAKERRKKEYLGVILIFTVTKLCPLVWKLLQNFPAFKVGKC